MDDDRADMPTKKGSNIFILPRDEDKEQGMAKARARMLEHISDLLFCREIPDFPDIPDDVAAISRFRDIHEELAEIRRWIKACAFENPIGGPRGESILSGHLRVLAHKFLTVPENHGTDRLKERAYYNNYPDGLDAVTGAFKHTLFIGRSIVELEAAFRQNERCCLAIVEPDSLGALRERFGQAADNKILRHMVRAMSAHLRKTDFVGCYEGRERLILFFRNTDLRVCSAICGRLLKSLADVPIMLEKSPMFVMAKFGIAMASSEEFGVEPWNGSDISWGIPQELMDRADMALGEAKAGQRIMCYRIPESTKEAAGCFHNR
jgi:diguanylate cyclase (GGDEF)-like protein